METMSDADFMAIWGKWECPKCGAEHEDPNEFEETTCDCGLFIKLGPAEYDGDTREATILILHK